MLSPVATIGCTFEGYCTICGENVTGTLITGEFPTIDDQNICVVGSTGVGSCGHTTQVVSGSSVWFIEDKAVARIGDQVSNNINGTITSGTFVQSE